MFLTHATLLPAESPAGLELVAQLQTDNVPGDLWVHGSFAYLGSDTCGKGVRPVDVSDPSHPQALPYLAENTRSTAEDVVVIAANTAAFTGDLLVTGLQSCKTGGEHGAEFWDVTDPRQPRRLGFFDTGEGTRGVHELYVFQRGDRVFALLAAPFSERAGQGGDFRIVDATDPAHPQQVADWGVRKNLGLDPASLARGGSPTVYCHSAWANADGTRAYLSYWDAGVILLDISDPSAPQYLGRTTFAPGEEGNAHSVWGVPGKDLLLAADEDFNWRGALLDVSGQDGAAGPMTVIEAGLGPPMCTLGSVSGDIAYSGGQGCGQSAADVAGKVALVDFGGCELRDKLLWAQQAGALAVLVASDSDTRLPSETGGDSSGIDIPAGMVSKADGDRLKGGPASVVLRSDPEHTWGYLRIFDTTDPANLRQVASFRTLSSRSCPPPDGGIYSIHNPFVVGDTAYLSWYSDGVRAVDISDPANPREIASYAAPVHPMDWGVYVQDGLVYLSDMNNGLIILRRTPAQ